MILKVYVQVSSTIKVSSKVLMKSQHIRQKKPDIFQKSSWTCNGTIKSTDMTYSSKWLFCMKWF